MQLATDSTTAVTQLSTQFSEPQVHLEPSPRGAQREANAVTWHSGNNRGEPAGPTLLRGAGQHKSHRHKRVCRQGDPAKKRKLSHCCEGEQLRAEPTHSSTPDSGENTDAGESRARIMGASPEPSDLPQ